MRVERYACSDGDVLFVNRIEVTRDELARVISAEQMTQLYEGEYEWLDVYDDDVS